MKSGWLYAHVFISLKRRIFLGGLTEDAVGTMHCGPKGHARHQCCRASMKKKGAFVKSEMMSRARGGGGVSEARQKAADSDLRG